MTSEQKKAAIYAALQEERRYILEESESEYFIEKYCKIESKDNLGDAAVPFNLWDAQKKALTDFQENKLNIVLKARQLGLTWLVVCFLVHQCLRFSGFTALILSETEIKSKELVNRADFVLRHLPSWLIIPEKKYKELKKDGGDSYSGLYWIKTTLSIEIHYGDESREVASIKAQACTEGAGRSLTGDIVFFDEWAFHSYASQIFDAAYPTINRPESGKFIGLSTNYRGSFFESVWKNADKKGFHKIFLNCFSDPRRTEEWYEQTCRALGSKVQQEYPRTEEEALLAGDNISFPEFSYDIHVCEPFEIPSHWRRIASVDNGYNDPYAWYKAAISEDGIVYVYYEQSRWRDEPQVLYDEQAREFNNSLFYYNEDTKKMDKEKLDYIVAGLDAWHTSGAGRNDKTSKNLIDYYEEGGLKESFIQAVTDRRLRKATLHEYLKPIVEEHLDGTKRVYAKLQIFPCCEYLISILPQLVNDDHDPEKVADLSDIDNPYDSLGYLLISRHINKSKELAGRDDRTAIQKHKEMAFKTFGIKRRRLDR